MAALLALQNVSKTFGSLRVIDDLTLAVGEREALGVIGPNGAGKTTALNLMIGRLRPERGAVVFAGQDHPKHSVSLWRQLLLTSGTSTLRTCRLHGMDLD